MPVSKTAVYRHIEQGYYSISKIDLPRAAKFKPRKEKKGEYVPKGVKAGRTFEDFLLFAEENPSVNYIETDTVIGRVGGKVIMTFQFVNVDFMFGLLLDNKTAAEAHFYPEKQLRYQKSVNFVHFWFYFSNRE